MSDSHTNGNGRQDGSNGDGGGELTIKAAEFALGLGTDAELAAGAERLRNDRAFAGEVAFWQTRLAALADSTEAVEPPAELWHAIEAEIDARARVAPGAPENPALWNNVGFWRWSAMTSATAAMVAVIVLVTQLATPVPTPLAATLEAEGGGVYVVFVETGTRTVSARPVGVSRTADQVPELWVLPDSGKPISLGVIEPAIHRAQVLPESARPHVRAGASFAVSLEPSGGSPTGQPTGPVVATGKLGAL